jgi:hypothetical protein
MSEVDGSSNVPKKYSNTVLNTTIYNYLKGVYITLSKTVYIYIYIYIYISVSKRFLRYPTPRLHCFLSSHWSSFRVLSFMAFLTPSNQVFFGLPPVLKYIIDLYHNGMARIKCNVSIYCKDGPSLGVGTLTRVKSDWGRFCSFYRQTDRQTDMAKLIGRFGWLQISAVNAPEVFRCAYICFAYFPMCVLLAACLTSLCMYVYI